MSAEIKPGQIWQWNSALPGEPDLTVTKVEGDRVSYQYQGEGGECYRDVDHFTERAHLVKDVPATPAPLDPGKVKAGDTVTLTRGATSVTGRAHVGMPGAVSVYVPGANTWVNNSDTADDPNGGYALTAHTPAPEPEWKPGTFVKATSQRGAEVRGFIQEDGGLAFFDPEEGASYESHNYFNVRPLAVIDPAGVDVDALVETACYAVDHWLPAGVRTPATAAIRDAVHGVLRYIGIEVPR